jgi:transposase
MAAIVYQTCKQTGITYAYESVAYWDKSKQQSRAQRKLLGRVDPLTKEIVPTRKQTTRLGSDPAPTRPGPVPASSITRSFYGAGYLFDTILHQLGILEDLQQCFPHSWKALLSLSYFMILEDRNSLSRFTKWAATHTHPYGKSLPSQRISELFASITEEAKQHFFRCLWKRFTETEYWAYDITSISSYGKGLKQLRYGHNKDHELLPQINLALLFGEETELPFYYRKLAGNIPDVKTLRHLLSELRFFEKASMKVVMDRGFYSDANIQALCQQHLKFLIAVKTSLRFVQEELDQVRTSLRSWEHYQESHQCYALSRSIRWDYRQDRPYKGDTLEEKRRMYLHLYFNPAKALEEEERFHHLLHKLQVDLEQGVRDPAYEKQYEKYFVWTQTPQRGVKVKAKQEAIDQARKNYGYFTLLSNEIKDPMEALRIYRRKDGVEKAFGNLKEGLNFNRPRVSSDQSLDGKLFVVFLALIIISQIKKRMRKKQLKKSYTFQEVLDQLDVIEAYEQPGQRLRIGEMTQRQRDLYEALEVPPPTSLH